MRRKIISTLRYIPVLSFFMLFAYLYAGATPVSGATITQTPTVRQADHTGEISKILPVLEEKIHDRKLFEKSKGKVYNMGAREVGLVAALCEKISDEGETISSDIAFFLVTALIVLS